MTRISEKHYRELVKAGRLPELPLQMRLRAPGSSRAEKRAAALKEMEESYLAKAPRIHLQEPVSFEVPIAVATENKVRAMHPIHRGKMLKGQRVTVAQCWLLHFRGKIPELPVIVTFTRFGRHMDGHDSLAAAFKHVTDEITKLLGLRNDDTPEVTWRYEQQPRGSEQARIRIRVESRPWAVGDEALVPFGRDGAEGADVKIRVRLLCRGSIAWYVRALDRPGSWGVMEHELERLS